jgi:phosphate transport system substrate-binding protein
MLENASSIVRSLLRTTATSVPAVVSVGLMLSSASASVDSEIPVYKAVSGVSGTLKAIGSDSMNNEMAMWSEGFRKFYPGVKIEVEGKGSSTAPPALIEGTAHLGPMSRPMKSSEVDSFKAKFGYEPTEVRTSLDVLAVFVHRDNPLAGLSLEQIDGIFSKTRKSGAQEVKTWGDLGLTGEWAKQPIRLYGRNSASGTYGFFKDHALSKGDFKDTVKEQPGSSAVVQSVANDKFGIGYSGIGYSVPGVRAVPVSEKGTAYVEAKGENAYSGTYPLARFLSLYINKQPNAALDPLRKEFLAYVLSKEGQEAVEKNGYIPLTSAVIAAERQKLGIASLGVQ